MHGWQSEYIDGPKGGCDFWSGCSLQWSLHPHLQDVVWCNEVECNCGCRWNCGCSCCGSCSCGVVVVVAVVVVQA